MNGNYEHFLEMEQEGRAAYQLGDTTCSDCNQVICACESLAEWHNERELQEPTSFSQWLEQNGDSI